MRRRANTRLFGRKLPSGLVRLVLHVAVLCLLAQLSGLAHFIGDALFPHGAEVTSSCPDEREDGSDCPPGCPACHACDHRQAVPTPPLRISIPPRALASMGAEIARIDSPPSPSSVGVYRPPRA